MKAVPIAILLLLSATGLPAQPAASLASPAAKANEDCKFHVMLCNEVVSSELTERDCALPNGSFGDRWLFPAWSKQFLTAAAGSDAFTVQLRLITPGNRTLGSSLAQPGDTASIKTFAAINGPWSAAVISDASSAAKVGPYTLGVSCDDTPPCVTDYATLCLPHGRFRNRYRVQVAWENQFTENQVGFGRALTLPGSGGVFSFLGDDDLVVKILPFGDRVKVFYTQLTNLRFKMAVTDMVTNVTKIYRNTEGDCGGIDPDPFPGTASAALVKALGDCRPDTDTACLLNGRFAVEVDWTNHYNGESGRGRRLGESGFFYFTESSNYEVVVKFVDFGDRIKFFYGALSDFEYTIRVTDTLTGTVKTYHNPAGKFCGGIDNDAF